MRLNRFNPANIQVRDHRGGGGGMPGGSGGKLGCGAIAIVLVGALVFGADPVELLGTMEQLQQGSAQQSLPQQTGQTVEEQCSVNQFSLETCNALSSLNETWEPVLRASGVAFRQPTLHFYGGAVRSGCGSASAQAGPFYCPGDYGIYIDTSFYDVLEQRLGASGDFARYYVMAHEYGHHIQTITGLAADIRRAQQSNPAMANALQVRMELQADCYAGVWAGKNARLMEPGDIEEGMQAAHAIGDDTLMRNAGQRPVEAAFTHGSSAQRMEWLRRGMRSGDATQCDTFSDLAG